MNAVALVLIILTVPTKAPTGEVDTKAQEVIDRTHKTTVTHSVYYRAHWAIDGSYSASWWSAAFHERSRFRTESEQIRIVADCNLGTGTQLTLGKRLPGGFAYSFGARPAKQACGISTDRVILSAKWFGQKQSKFGMVDEVEIIEAKGRYAYGVGQLGEILSITMTRRDNPNPIVTEAFAVEYDLPSGDIFSPESLTRSFVPRKYSKD